VSEVLEPKNQQRRRSLPMQRKSLIIGALPIAVLALALTAWTGLTKASSLAQAPTGNLNIWVSTTEDGDPVRRLDPGTTEAQIVIESTLQTSRSFHVEVIDAVGILVFQHKDLTLPAGAYSTTIPLRGKDFFQSYLNGAQTQEAALAPAINEAIIVLEEERAKDPCFYEPPQDDPSKRTNPARVASRIEQVLGLQGSVDSILQQLLRFNSLESDARTDITDAQAALAALLARGSAAIEKLQVPDDAPRCPPPLEHVPDWEPDWDSVRADLDEMLAAANTVGSKIDSAVAAVDSEADRSFPSTAIVGQCSQNVLQLVDANSQTASADFWWTVGTAGAPARLTNPQQPTLTGTLQTTVGQIYATTVIHGEPITQTTIHALVLDAQCVPVEGATVNFAVAAEDAGQANLSANQVATNANGEAEVTLTATDTLGDGTVQVTATVDSASASTTVNVIGPPETVEFRGGLVSLSNFGVNDIVPVTVIVRDANGRNVIDGTPVTFSINPPDHAFSDGAVSTDNGQATATLVFGDRTGVYTVQAQAGGADGPQRSRGIRVVGVPSSITVKPLDPNTGAPINTIFVRPTSRSAEIQVEVWSDEAEGIPAPDTTVVEFDFGDENDWCWAGFSAPTPREDRYLTTLSNGRASATLVVTNISTAEQGCIAGEGLAYEQIHLRVTATYEPRALNPDARTQIEQTVRIDLRGQSVFLPLVSRR
jgi:hypothetical protein